MVTGVVPFPPPVRACIDIVQRVGSFSIPLLVDLDFLFCERERETDKERQRESCLPAEKDKDEVNASKYVNLVS